jgi:uroporphyrinogen-III synthase
VPERRCKTLILSPDDSIARDLEDVVEVVWVPIVRLSVIQGSSLRLLESMKLCSNVAFTSPRAVRALLEDAKAHGVLGELLSSLSRAFIAVIGSKTGEEVLKQLGRPPDYIASRHYSGSMLLELIEKRNVKCLVTPRSSEGIRELNTLAEVLGVTLIDISVYKPEPLTEGVRRARELIAGGLVDVVVLSSPMIARLLCESIAGVVYTNVRFIAMGETTYKSIPNHCIEPTNIMVGDGSVETLKAIIKSMCG